MIICAAPLAPRQSPMFLEVPKALPHRRPRSRSRPRETDMSAGRTRSRQRDSPTPVATYTIKSPAAPYSSDSVKNPVPTTAYLQPPIGGNGRKRIDSPPPTKHVRPKSPTQKKPPPPHTTPQHQQADYHHRPVHPAEIFNDSYDDFYTPPSPSTPPSPPPATRNPPLRERLIGAWKLESYIAYPTATSPLQRAKYPMTKNVTGLIMYTPDGFMSAQMLIPGQQHFTKAGSADDSQWAEAGKRCFAYCGPYYVTNDGVGREEVLRHSFQFCSLPGWVGDVQTRTWAFEEDGDVLVLGSEEPVEIQGDMRKPVLKWRRCRDNTNASPPPPVPLIKVSGPGEA